MEPKPCPFCGKKATPLIRPEGPGPGCSRLASIGCRTLGCLGDAFHQRFWGEDELSDAVTAWNRRAMPAEVNEPTLDDQSLTAAGPWRTDWDNLPRSPQEAILLLQENNRGRTWANMGLMNETSPGEWKVKDPAGRGYTFDLQCFKAWAKINLPENILLRKFNMPEEKP